MEQKHEEPDKTAMRELLTRWYAELARQLARWVAKERNEKETKP